jgi:hypothetical protein
MEVNMLAGVSVLAAALLLSTSLLAQESSTSHSCAASEIGLRMVAHDFWAAYSHWDAAGLGFFSGFLVRTTLHATSRLISAIAAGLLISSISVAAQEPNRATRQLPAPTDVDPRLTELLQRLEQNLADAILHKDVDGLGRLVGPRYSLRIADVPQGSMPRATWMDRTLHKLKPESIELQHLAARKLAANLAVVSLIHKQRGSIEGRDFSGEFYVVDLWQQNTGRWQIVARYSSPVGKRVDRGSRPLPPPTDIDPRLTDTLGQLEQRLGDAALHGFKDTMEMERLVGSEFTLRTSDAPEWSLPRALWGQPSGRYKIESLHERYYAARKLTDDLAVVSLLLTQKASLDGRDRSGDFYVVDIWKQRGDRWQLIARYSSPLGKTFDRMPPR